MNTLQYALKQAFPEEIERIAKEERRRKFEESAARGRDLLRQAGQLVEAGDLEAARKEVLKNRYACACALAKEGKKPVPAGFVELKNMEDFLALQLSKSNGRVDSAGVIEGQAVKEVGYVCS